MLQCPACNSTDILQNQEVYDVAGMKVCQQCDAVFGSCYLGDSYRIVKPYFTSVEPAHEDTRYYDLECLGSTGVERRHGWLDKTNNMIVQTG